MPFVGEMPFVGQPYHKNNSSSSPSSQSKNMILNIFNIEKTLWYVHLPIQTKEFKN